MPFYCHLFNYTACIPVLSKIALVTEHSASVSEEILFDKRKKFRRKCFWWSMTMQLPVGGKRLDLFNELCRFIWPSVGTHPPVAILRSADCRLPWVLAWITVETGTPPCDSLCQIFLLAPNYNSSFSGFLKFAKNNPCS